MNKFQFLSKLNITRLINIVIILLAIFIGAAIGISFYKQSVSCKSVYKYINSSLNCSTSSFDKSNPIVLIEDINKYIISEKNKGGVDDISVYFRDLKDGPVFGVNENDLYISASLLKLPIALTLFSLSEDKEPGILEKNILYEQEGELDKTEQYFTPLKSAVPGGIYSINELIYYSLVYSDNAANEVLKSYLKKLGAGQDLVLTTLKDLGLSEPTSLASSDISTRGYASIFRILYNASYLSLENSEKVLSILSQTEFKKGIVAGVPDGLSVANKFGERDLGENKQLHDCGIIYYPDNPYILCVMTRGKDYDTLASVIRKISSMVYAEMDSRANNK